MRQPRVLIVEDDLLVSRGTAALLEEWGYRVAEPARSGEKAIESAKETPPDLALIDIALDGPMDGIETAERLMDETDCAIVYITAHTDSTLFERAKATRPGGYLIKPVSPMDLQRAVEMAIYRKDLGKLLAGSENRLAHAVKAADLAPWEWRPESDTPEFSENWYALLGYDVGNVPSDAPDLRRVIHPDDFPRMMDRLRRHAEGETASYRFEYGARAESGEWRRMEGRGKVVDRDEEGRPTRVVGLDRDITDAAREEESRARLDELKAVAGGIAHNFNNALQLLLGRGELARRSLDSGNLEDLRTNLDDMLETIRVASKTAKLLQSFTEGGDPTSQSDAFDALRIGAPPHEGGGGPADSPDLEQKSVPRLSVLVIDDLKPIVDMVKQGLSRLDQKVSTALSGDEGLESFRADPADVVICDLAMPGMNGWTVGKRIREFCRSAGIPKPVFIILTGWGDQSHQAAKIAESGVDAVVEKPLDITALFETLRELEADRAAEAPSS